MWISTGTRFDPYCAGQSGVHPPRNSTVAIAETVTILAYSAIKNEANFIDEYSVWNPATNSFSASGRSNGTRFVSAKAARTNSTKLTKCGKTVHLGTKPSQEPDRPPPISPQLNTFR